MREAPAGKRQLRATLGVMGGRSCVDQCWRATIGFNASHSMSVMLLGIIYAYFALAQPGVRWQSTFLLALGLIVLVAYLTLAKLYCFRVLFRGVALAAALYLAGLIAHAA